MRRPEGFPRWYAIDTCIALENLVIAATGLGLGTCWIGSFDEEEIAAMLELPANLKVVALLSLGFPREKIDAAARLLHWIRPRKSLRKSSRSKNTVTLSDETCSTLA